jgi:hypothetical protein
LSVARTLLHLLSLVIRNYRTALVTRASTRDTCRARARFCSLPAKPSPGATVSTSLSFWLKLRFC